MSEEQMAYRIIKWKEKHSNAEAAKRERLDWIKCPARFDSLGLRTLMTKKGGLEAFGVYVLLAEIAAMAPKKWRDGRIINDDGKALNVTQIALKLNVSRSKIEKTMKLLTADDIGWIDRVPDGASDQPKADGSTPTETHVTAQEPGNGEVKNRRESTENRRASIANRIDPLAEREREREREEEREREGEKTKRARADFSLSLSPAAPEDQPSPPPKAERKRQLARMRYVTAMLPLLGRRGAGRCPPGSPEHRADETCMARIFDDLWPEDDPADETGECAEALSRLLRHLDGAKGARTPMAWIQDKLKREGVLDAA